MDEEKSLSAVNDAKPGRSSAGFESWLTNTFWFHYKWYFIAAVFGISILIMILVGLATRSSYDWTVVYAHYGAEDGESCDRLAALLEDALPETGKNRSIDVKVIDLACGEDAMSAYGERLLYSYLHDQNSMVFILDDGFRKCFSSLGYFPDAAELSAMPGFYSATNDSPVLPLSAEDEQYSDYSQDFLDDVYDEYVAEHAGLLAKARSVLKELSK